MTLLWRLAPVVSLSSVVVVTLLSQPPANAPAPVTATPTVLEAMRTESGRASVTFTPGSASPERCGLEQLYGSIDPRRVGSPRL